MGIYLGEIGSIELTRLSAEDTFASVVNPSDVNVNRDRFSFDFNEGTFITGDLLEITTTDGTNLDFISATGWANSAVQPSGNWYIFVDEIGGINLYNSFAESLDGGTTGRVPLTAIARNIPISARVRDRDTRILGSVVDYELNTSREAVDITALSDEYRQQYSGLISGSGRLTAHWDYAGIAGQESVHYLMQLILRTEVGSAFHARFYIKSADTAAQAGNFDATQLNDSLWWEFDAVVTGAAVNFAPDSLINGVIDFVATGPIRMRAQTQQKRYLLQEDTSKIKLEQDGAAFVLLEEAD